MAFFHHHHHHGEGKAPGARGFHTPLPAETSPEFHLLEPSELTFELHGSKLMAWRGDETEGREVHLFRLFPISEPDDWVSVVDGEGKEMGIIKSLRALDHDTRKLLADELHRRYTLPRILRIVSSKEKSDLVEWQVETDRGPRNFHTRSLRDNTQEPEPNNYILTDLDGNRYHIPDFGALDPRSRGILEKHL